MIFLFKFTYFLFFKVVLFTLTVSFAVLGCVSGVFYFPWPTKQLTIENTGRSLYDKHTNFFNALTDDLPEADFEGETTIIVFDPIWNLNQLKYVISTITTEITRLEKLYRQYSGIVKGGLGDAWPTNTLNTNGGGG